MENLEVKIDFKRQLGFDPVNLPARLYAETDYLRETCSLWELFIYIGACYYIEIRAKYCTTDFRSGFIGQSLFIALI